MISNVIESRQKRKDMAILLFLQILLVLLGTAAIFTPTLAGFGSSIQMDAGDSLLNLLFLENGYTHLWGGEHWLHFNEWLNPGYFYPYSNVLAWSDHALIPSALYGFLRHFLRPAGAYGLWMIATAALNFLIFSNTLQRFVRPSIAIAIAFASSYGLIQLSQLGHSQLLTQWFISPCLLCSYDVTMLLQRAISRQARINSRELMLKATRLCLFIVATFLCSYYLFFMLLLASGFIIIAGLSMSRLLPLLGITGYLNGRHYPNSPEPPLSCVGRLKLPAQRTIAIQVGILAILLVPAIKLGSAYIDSYQLHGGRQLSLYPFERPDSFQPWLTTTFQSGDLLLPPPVTVEALRGDVTNLAENGLFNGYIYLACFFLALAIISSALVKARVHAPLNSQLSKSPLASGSLLPEELLAHSLIFFLGSFGIGLVIFEAHNYGLWQGLFSALPGGSAIRAISRFGFVQLYLSSIAMAFAFEYYFQSFFQSRKLDRLLAWLAGIAVSLSFLNGLGAHPFADVASFFPMVQSIHSEAASRNCKVVYFHAGQFNPLVANALALQQSPNIKVINGYSGWPSPLATRLDSINTLDHDALRRAVELENFQTTPSQETNTETPLTYCQLEYSPNGRDLVFKAK